MLVDCCPVDTIRCFDGFKSIIFVNAILIAVDSHNYQIAATSTSLFAKLLYCLQQVLHSSELICPQLPRSGYCSQLSWYSVAHVPQFLELHSLMFQRVVVVHLLLCRLLLSFFNSLVVSSLSSPICHSGCSKLLQSSL